jgi:hypothetical protein
MNKLNIERDKKKSQGEKGQEEKNGAKETKMFKKFGGGKR